MKKRLISGFMALFLLGSSLPCGVIAASTPVVSEIPMQNMLVSDGNLMKGLYSGEYLKKSD